MKATGFDSMIREDGIQQPSTGDGYSGDGASINRRCGQWCANNWNDFGLTQDLAHSTQEEGPESMSSMEWPSRCSRRAWVRCNGRKTQHTGPHPPKGFGL